MQSYPNIYLQQNTINYNQLQIPKKISEQRINDFLQGRIPKEDPDFARCQQYLSNQPKTKPRYIQTDQICNICMEPIQILDRYLLQCGHVFGAQCMHSWINQQLNDQMTPLCPSCKQNIL